MIKFTSIPYYFGLRILRICSEPEDLKNKMEELKTMLISRNYNKNIVNPALAKALLIPREVALQRE